MLGSEEEFIEVEGAKVHNLKNISVKINIKNFKVLTHNTS